MDDLTLESFGITPSPYLGKNDYVFEGWFRYDEYLLLGVRNKETGKWVEKGGDQQSPGSTADLAFYNSIPQAKALHTRAVKKHILRIKQNNYSVEHGNYDDKELIAVPTLAEVRELYEIVRVPLPK